MIVRPADGEVVEDDLATLEALEARVDRFLRGMSLHYELRRQLRARIAELRGAPKLPPRRFRTSTQERVATCPRCGHNERRAA